MMPGAKGKILVVDENVDFAENVAEVLGEFGYSSDRVADARAALQVAADYDCIVSEQSMPHLSGIELIRELRRRGSAVPVVLLGEEMDVIEQEARSAGALLVLSKYGFEQWACALLNALARLRRPATGTMRKATSAVPVAGQRKASGIR